MLKLGSSIRVMSELAFDPGRLVGSTYDSVSVSHKGGWSTMLLSEIRDE